MYSTVRFIRVQNYYSDKTDKGLSKQQKLVQYSTAGRGRKKIISSITQQKLQSKYVASDHHGHEARDNHTSNVATKKPKSSIHSNMENEETHADAAIDTIRRGAGAPVRTGGGAGPGGGRISQTTRISLLWKFDGFLWCYCCYNRFWVSNLCCGKGRFKPIQTVRGALYHHFFEG